MPFSPPSLHGVKTHKPLYRSPERAEGTRLEETWVVKYPVVPGIFLRCSQGSPANFTGYFLIETPSKRAG